MAKCPNCGSENISVQMMTTEMKTKNYSTGFGGRVHNTGRGLLAVGTLGLSNLFVRKRFGEEQTKVGSAKVYLCQNCGYSSDGRDFIGSANSTVVPSEGFSPSDPTVRKAVEICIKQKKFSTAMLQTWLGKGHDYVTSLGVWLADIGIIGPANGSKPRDVFITSLDEFDQLTKPSR